MTDVQIRRFNLKGLEAFSHWLDENRTQPGEPPIALLDDPNLTEVAPNLGSIGIKTFTNKYEMGKHVLVALGSNWEAHINDAGLMPWLSLAFHTSTMLNSKGQLFIGTASRHVLALDIGWKNYSHCRRHLVRSAVFFIGHYGEKGRVFLAKHPCEASKLEEQVPARIKKGLAYCHSLAEAIYQLYWDEGRETYRRGSRGEGRGGIVRLIKILEQLDVTFDIQTITGEQLIALLPKLEFEHFMPKESVKTQKRAELTAAA